MEIIETTTHTLSDTRTRVIFEAFIFREQPIQFLFVKSNFTNEILMPRSSTLIIFHDFNFRGLAVLSRNSRNINASKITRYTVAQEHTLQSLVGELWTLKFNR